MKFALFPLVLMWTLIAPRSAFAQDETLPHTVRAIAWTSNSEPRAVRWSNDAWLGRDKQLHFTASALLTLSGQYIFVNKAGLPESRALPLSAGYALWLGLAKEMDDAQRPGGTGFSHKDLVWNVLGTGAALLIIVL